MKYAILGQSGLLVSRLAFGAMTFGSGNNHIEHETVPFAVRNKVGLTVWSPLAGGFLSGKYTKENLSDDQNRLKLEDNLQAVELQLSAGDIARLEEITRPVSLYPNWFTAMTNDTQTAEALGL